MESGAALRYAGRNSQLMEMPAIGRRLVLDKAAVFGGY